MEIIDPSVKTFVLDFFLSPVAVFFNLLLVARIMACFTLELVKPARSVSYRKVLRDDCFAYIGFVYIITPLVLYIYRFVPSHFLPSLPLHALPVVVTVSLYLVFTDFGDYWIHRLMHTPYFWRAHKFHHSPTSMYWLTGVRSTVPQQLFVGIPNLVVSVLFLKGVPPWIFLAIGTFASLQNDFMHINFTWRSKWLEWFLVTPRYHHIHHSTNPEHYGANIGVVFTFWDRLFGTYLDPEKIDGELSFGLDSQDTASPWRLVIGV